ncbi:MAG: hypothetical protein JW881_04445 [Spirochaetales bacterium]|nr:hypothetical protein [Spirochaetales bacterium]
MKDLGSFLVKAKINTYAAQKGHVSPSRRASKDMAYTEGDYYYLDSYFGERDFSGQEIVYFRDKPVWCMNYYGTMLKEDPPPGFIETLREALLKVTVAAPFRGPEEYRRGTYIYRCSHEGTVSFFKGTEDIRYDGEEVYRLYFHGGDIY